MSQNPSPLIVAVDFDGTCVTHEYPRVGREIGAVPVLRRIVESGGQLILWTMRSGQPLQDAVQWFEGHQIPLFGIQRNPEQDEWTSSPKAYANLYIDDAAYPDILSADDAGDSASEHSFCPFAYYPHCGKEVAHEAKIVADRIQEHWEKHWVRYGEIHGQEELKRARKSS